MAGSHALNSSVSECLDGVVSCLTARMVFVRAHLIGYFGPYLAFSSSRPPFLVFTIRKVP